MELEEFHEQVRHFIETLADAQQGLSKENASLNSTLYLSMMSRHLLRSVNEVGELCKHFHDGIEFSPHLPLSVVPFLLPLIVSLKKVGTQVSHLKSHLKGDRIQVEDYQGIRSSVEKLDDECHEIVMHVRFLLDQARFREKSA